MECSMECSTECSMERSVQYDTMTGGGRVDASPRANASPRASGGFDVCAGLREIRNMVGNAVEGVTDAIIMRDLRKTKDTQETLDRILSGRLAEEQRLLAEANSEGMAPAIGLADQRCTSGYMYGTVCTVAVQSLCCRCAVSVRLVSRVIGYYMEQAGRGAAGAESSADLFDAGRALKMIRSTVC